MVVADKGVGTRAPCDVRRDHGRRLSTLTTYHDHDILPVAVITNPQHASLSYRHGRVLFHRWVAAGRIREALRSRRLLSQRHLHDQRVTVAPLPLKA